MDSSHDYNRFPLFYDPISPRPVRQVRPMMEPVHLEGILGRGLASFRWQLVMKMI